MARRVRRPRTRFLVAGALAVLLGQALVVGGTVDAIPQRPLDIAVTATPSRTTAASGQAILVTGTGCLPGGHDAVAELFEGTSPDLLTEYSLAAAEAPVAPDGSFAVQLDLVNRRTYTHPSALPEGDHTLVAWCNDPNGDDYIRSETQTITVAGAKPSDQVEGIRNEDRTDFVVEGSACDQATVTVEYRFPGDETGAGRYEETDEVVPDASGGWVAEWDGPAGIYADVYAYCGDPLADGFVYERFQVPLRSISIPVVDTTTTTSTPAPVDAGSSGVEPTAARPIAGTASYAG